MNKVALEKWFKRDVKESDKLALPNAGVELEMEGLDWNRTQNLLKKNTIPKKDGSSIRNQEGYAMDLIASSIKKVNGQPFNFYDKETLEAIGVQTHEQAINKLFKVAEIAKILQKSRELSGDTPEAEEAEVEELKN